jgi:hypothetical protein
VARALTNRVKPPLQGPLGVCNQEGKLLYCKLIFFD